ncbi:MAG TPA: hypothetical protein VJZ04_12100 [Lachnospiraceae bacterium]|nr:hypothetical protein [Lachnospiraceae bacterium]
MLASTLVELGFMLSSKLGQGAWIEEDVLSINPDLKIGFNGYPVSDKEDQCQVISGSDQSLYVYKDSKVLQPTLEKPH